MKRTILTFTLLCIGIASLVAQSPLGFNYQAIIRNAAGEIVATQQIGLQISIIQGSITGNAVYTETFTPTTNEFGLVNLTIGQGNQKTGTYADIEWSTADYFLKVELDIAGNSNFVEMGISQLLSVPFANYAFSGNDGKSAYEVWLSLGNAGSEDDFINSLTGPSGTSSWTDQDTTVSTSKRVGIGTDNPASMLEVVSDGSKEDDVPLFEVKNSKGETVFAVYENGVQVIIENNPESKTRGGFAVSGRTSSKEPIDILHVTPEFTRVYVDETSTKTRGGFAVSGRTSSKEDGGEIFLVTPELTQVFVEETEEKTRGGFAVSGRTSSKTFDDLLMITPSLTQFYVDNSTTKTRGGFAVSGRTSSKETLDILHVTPDFTRVYVDEPTTKTRGGFAVSGRTSSKENEGAEIFRVSPGLTEVFVEKTTSTKTRGGFAVSGRTSSKDQGIYDVFTVVPERTDVFIKPGFNKFFPDGFSISMFDESFVAQELFSVSDAGTVINTVLAVAPKLTTASVANITQISAMGGGKVLDNGGSEIMARGLIYNLANQRLANIESIDELDPSIAGIVYDWEMTEGGMGEFSGLLMEYLTPGTSYTVRAFASNMDGLSGYGSAVTFKTLDPDTLTFDIREAETEKIISNAIITLWPNGVPEPIVNAPGNYLFAVASGTHYYNVEAPGYYEDWGELTNTGNYTQQVWLNPMPSSVIFNVKDSDGNAVESGEIIVKIEGQENMYGYIYEGSAEIWDVPEGTWDFIIYSYGFEDYNGTITIVQGEDLAVNVTLTSLPKFTLLFEVTNSSTSLPVVGAEVYLSVGYGELVKDKGYYYEPIQTDEAGKAIFEVLANDNYEYSIYHESYEGAWNNLSVAKDTTVKVSLIPLPVYQQVTFNVKDANEIPIEYGDIRIDIDPDSDHIIWGYISNGVAVMEYVPVGTWNYVIYSYGFQDFYGSITVVEGQDLIVNVTLVEPPKYTVTFEVINNESNPLLGAGVWLYKHYEYKNGSKYEYFAETNDLGIAILENIPEGEYEYYISYEDLWTEGLITVHQDTQINVTLTPPPKYTVTFVVDNQSGDRVEGASVTFQIPYKEGGKSGAKYYETISTDAEGYAIFYDVPENNYQYDVYHDTYGGASDSVYIEADSTISVTVTPFKKGDSLVKKP